MRIRSKNDLKDSLDRDLAWRKQELTSILSNVNRSEANALKTALRTSILLLYAHWEGFVKNAAKNYLSFVANQKLKLSDLDDAFLAIALRQKIFSFSETNDSTMHAKFVAYMKSGLEDEARIQYDNVINAQSNLNSEVLKRMLVSIGIDFATFELKSNLIDEKLLHYRNTIAHGEFLLLDQNEYRVIHSDITSMISEIKNRIENAVFLEDYKR